MSKSQTMTALLFLVAFALARSTAGAETPPPKITKAEFSTSAHELTLDFNEPMLTWVGTSAPEGVSIAPDLPCKWSWSNDSQLTCNTPYDAEEPRPATRYHIAISGALWSQSGIEIAAQDVTAESIRPQIENAGIQSWNGGEPTIELRINMTVAPAELRAALDVSLDGRPIEFQLDEVPRQVHGAWNSPLWHLRPATEGRPGILAVSERPGLRALGGDLRGNGHALLLGAFVNEPFRLRQIGCNERAHAEKKWQDASTAGVARMIVRCAAGEGIDLEFSAALERSSLDALRSQLPNGLRLTKTDSASIWQSRRGHDVLLRPGYVARVVTDRANKTFEFEIPATLRSDAAVAIDGPTRIAVQATDFLPAFKIAPAKMLLPVGERATLSVFAINEPHLDVHQRELSSDVAHDIFNVVDVRGRNEVKKIALPDASRELRERGGLVNGRVEHPSRNNNYYNGYAYSVAYAPFNISVGKSGNKFLAWITHWQGATGIAGAKVELLHIDKMQTLSVVATATTDNDGIAELDRPAASSHDQYGDKLLIRATQNDRVAIVPLLDELKSSREPAYDATGEGEQLTWGVSDRPLYRPGETVHYRVWMRERSGNRLLVAPNSEAVTFSIASMFGDTRIDQFDVRPDRYGSVTGEFRLPQTLHDDNYCIGPAVHYLESGACFRVTGYHINEMWADLRADRAIAHEGDVVEFTATAGYFSGGAAVNATAQFESLLTPQRLEDAYPKYRGYTFIDPFAATQGRGGESFSEMLPRKPKTDARGHVTTRVKLENTGLEESLASEKEKPIPFGLLEFSVSIATSGANAATSSPTNLRFSRYRRFVGIKVEPWLLRAEADPQLSAIVIDEGGNAVADAIVRLQIEEVVSDDSSAVGKILAHCELGSGHSSSCAFRPPHSGRYRFRASSEAAAEVSLERYAITETNWTDSETKDRARLLANDEHVAAGANAELILQQPFAKAQVLFSIEHGHVLKHWVQPVDAPVAKISFSVANEWAPGATVHALILDAGEDPLSARAAKDSLAETASVDLQIAGTPRPDALSLVVDRARAHPGEEIALTLRNTTSGERQLTLAIVDDAARTMAPELASAGDPKGNAWLGKLASWNASDWYGLGNWPRAAENKVDPTAPFSIESASPMVAFYAQSPSLETITVTGSKIDPADIFTRGLSADHSLRPPPRGANLAKASVRTHFAESALWDTDIMLAAGAERVVRVRLPDNLTRWRIMAWSNDAADAFSLAEATVEAALPIELRTEIPTRLFPGDETTLGASIRNHSDASRTISAQFEAAGAGTKNTIAWQGRVGPNAEQRIALQARPTAIGKIEVDTQARDKTVADAIAGLIEVASPTMHQHVPVAGWLQETGARLKLPDLPAGAIHSRLRVEVGRGLVLFAKSWIEALRDYPHRCWEQILSRAVGAAAAKRLGVAPTSWVDADATIDEALHAAGQYQDSSGLFHFFAGQYGQDVSSASPFLTAYTIRSFSFLRSMGYTVPAAIEKSAKDGLAQILTRPDADGSRWRNRWDELASVLVVADADAKISSALLDNLWNERDKLSWSSRADLALVLASRAEFADRSRELVNEMRVAGVKHGTRRVLESKSPASWWPFASQVSDQCAVAGSLAKLDHSADAADVRNDFLRGIADLYAGGAPPMHTQANARCLMTLTETAPTWGADQRIQVFVSGVGPSATMELEPSQSSSEWQANLPPIAGQVELHNTEGSDALVSYVADVEYDIDGRLAQTTAIGFSIERHYSVMREHKWKDVSAAAIREGDWVRVGLRINTKDLRRFVAITDTVAGGVRPADLELSGVSDTDLRNLASGSSPYFSEHQIDDRYARFYAEVLPPGTHEIYYYERAAHVGTYATLPAVAELMYGSASVARTTADRVRIENQPANQ